MLNPAAGLFDGHKGPKLYYKFYSAQNSSTRIVMLHGAGEYSEKYTRFGEWFCAKGIDVYLMDLRGHGRSSGAACDIDDFTEYILDLDLCLKSIEAKDGVKYTFLVSHSIGGLISIFYCLNFLYKVKGVVACSPCMGVKLKLEPIKAWFVNMLYPILKDRSFASNVRPKIATHDNYIIEKFENDPLIHNIVTASFYIQMRRAMDYAKANAHDLRVPLLILQAGDDRICEAKMAESFYGEAGSKDKAFKLYEGFYHEILNETGRETVYNDIYNWIKPRCV